MIKLSFLLQDKGLNLIIISWMNFRHILRKNYDHSHLLIINKYNLLFYLHFLFHCWIHLVGAVASFLAASCKSCVSTSSPGSWTYLTTDPLMKQFFTDNWKKNYFTKDRNIYWKITMWGYFSVSVTLISVSFMLRYWSTECRVPQMLKIRYIIYNGLFWKYHISYLRSFLSSTTTSFPTKDLKNE